MEWCWDGLWRKRHGKEEMKRARNGKKKVRENKQVMAPADVGMLLRRMGTDERAVARGLAGLVNNDAYRDASPARAQVYLRVLKECKACLEPSERASHKAREEEEFEDVELKHEVDRPERGEQVEEEVESN
jgi:hypothetical protein